MEWQRYGYHVKIRMRRVRNEREKKEERDRE